MTTIIIFSDLYAIAFKCCVFKMTVCPAINHWFYFNVVAIVSKTFFCWSWAGGEGDDVWGTVGINQPLASNHSRKDRIAPIFYDVCVSRLEVAVILMMPMFSYRSFVCCITLCWQCKQYSIRRIDFKVFLQVFWWNFQWSCSSRRSSSK